MVNEQYVYKCSECSEQTIDYNPNLKNCPHCMHALMPPQMIGQEPEVIGRLSPRAGLISKLDVGD